MSSVGADLASARTRELVREALERLGIRRLVLGIFDRAFPADPEGDTGAGSPYGEEGARFVEYAAQLGFDGIQLGPQGDTRADNPSPYDGTSAARGLVAVSLTALAGPEWARLLPVAALDAAVRGRTALPRGRVAYRHAHAAHRAALREAFDALRRRGGDPELRPLAARFDAFAARHAHWLEADALYEVLRQRHAGAEWPDWPDACDRRLACPKPGEAADAARRCDALAREHADALAGWRFCQFVAHEQHARLRERARAAGLRLYGDLPVGISPRELWPRRTLWWDAYRLGAPPSRTNPEGQPWGYAVLDPAQPDALRAFVAARFRKLFGEYDGVRLDHPHGYVCPWVYDARDPDPGRAVRDGARLLCSPNLPDHPALAPFAIPRPDQLNPDPATPRHADDWVVALDDEQVARYAAQVETLLEVAREHGAGPEDVACEVLSTLPYPLARVLQRHGLGRFRVTQKTDLRDPRDVYRGENAAPEDWIMVGNHDTPTLWSLADAWSRDDPRPRAEYLAGRLRTELRERDAFAARLAADPRRLAQAQLADLFLGPARQVTIFFTDAFGLREPYNRPGTVSGANWSLRLAPEWRDTYERAASSLCALNLPLALSLALRARSRAARESGLIEALEARAGAAARDLSR